MAMLCWLMPGLPHAETPTYFTGAVLDEADYLGVERTPPLARGDLLGQPARVSLKRFVPTPGNQGRQGSCVGWATAYAARTLAEARRLSVDDRSAIAKLRFSPAFVYNQVKDGGCDRGSKIPEALNLMRTQGVVPLSAFPYDAGQCHAMPSPALAQQAGNYRIKGYSRLFNSDSTAKHVAVRRALAQGRPVVIGMWVSDEFNRVKEVYQPSANDARDLALGRLEGHAMTVIGYDDSKYGGAFELVNSWGTQWGNGGFAWVRYQDFNTYVRQGYEMVPPDPPRPPAAIDMSASVRFIGFDGKPMAVERDPQHGYRLAGAHSSGTRFRVEAQVKGSGYVYVLGADDSGDVVTLFPRERGVSPHVNQASLLLPGPTEDYFTRLNEQVGTDYYVLLFAREPLQVDDLRKRLREAQGPLRKRLDAVLGKQQVPSARVTPHKQGVGFEAASDGARVVPVVVAIEHVEAQPGMRDTAPPRVVLLSPAPDTLEAALDENPVRRVASRDVRIQGVAQDESAIQSVTLAGAEALRFSSRGPFEAELQLPDDGAVHEILVSAVDAAGNRSETRFRLQVASR